MKFLCCIDLDAFFFQVEALCDPSLNGQPVAIQQHDDVICLSYAARAMGVAKHCSPHVAKKRWPSLNFVHVPCSYGSKVSYMKYKEASRRVAKTLELHAPPGSIIENASIDEWFIDFTKPVEDMLRSGCLASGLEVASDFANHLRKKIIEFVKLQTSAGISTSKPLAKMAVRFGKPHGQFVIDDMTLADAMRRCPLRKLPFCCKSIGKKPLQRLIDDLASKRRSALVGDQQAANRSTVPQVMCADVLCHDLHRLEQVLGTCDAAKWLFDAVRGVFPAHFAQISTQPRALTLQVSMSLKPTKSLHSVRTVIGWLAQEVMDRIKIEKAASNRVPEQITMAVVNNSGKESSLSVGVHKLATTPIPETTPSHWSPEVQRPGATLHLPQCHPSLALQREDIGFSFSFHWQQIAQTFDLFVSSDPLHMPARWLGLSAKKFAQKPLEDISKFFSAAYSTRGERLVTDSTRHSEEKQLEHEVDGGGGGRMEANITVNATSVTRDFFGLPTSLTVSPEKDKHRTGSAAPDSTGDRHKRVRAPKTAATSRAGNRKPLQARSPKRTKIKSGSAGSFDSNLKIGHYFGRSDIPPK